MVLCWLAFPMKSSISKEGERGTWIIGCPWDNSFWGNRERPWRTWMAGESFLPLEGKREKSQATWRWAENLEVANNLSISKNWQCTCSVEEQPEVGGESQKKQSCLSHRLGHTWHRDARLLNLGTCIYEDAKSPSQEIRCWKLLSSMSDQNQLKFLNAFFVAHTNT